MVELGDKASYFLELLKKLEYYQNNEEKKFGDDMEQVILLITFLIQALQLAKENDKPSMPVISECNSLQINKVLLYLKEHMAEKLTLDDIAANFYISKYHLSHCFKLATGFSIMEYLINTRILKACQLLREGVHVQDAGEAVGFQSNGHFIRTFSTFTGISPKQYTRRFMESDKC